MACVPEQINGWRSWGWWQPRNQHQGNQHVWGELPRRLNCRIECRMPVMVKSICVEGSLLETRLRACCCEVAPCGTGHSNLRLSGRYVLGREPQDGEYETRGETQCVPLVSCPRVHTRWRHKRIIIPRREPGDLQMHSRVWYPMTVYEKIEPSGSTITPRYVWPYVLRGKGRECQCASQARGYDTQWRLLLFDAYVVFLEYETSAAECSEMNTNIHVLPNVQRWTQTSMFCRMFRDEHKHPCAAECSEMNSNINWYSETNRNSYTLEAWVLTTSVRIQYAWLWCLDWIA